MEKNSFSQQRKQQKMWAIAIMYKIWPQLQSELAIKNKSVATSYEITGTYSILADPQSRPVVITIFTYTVSVRTHF